MEKFGIIQMEFKRNKRGVVTKDRCVGEQALRSMNPAQQIELLEHLKAALGRKYFGEKVNPEDIAGEAVKQVLTGQRTSWDENFAPFENLWLISKSIASNILTKEKRGQQVLQNSPEVFEQWALSERRTPEALCEQHETERSRWKKVYLAIGNDVLLKRMVGIARLIGEWDPDEMSKRLGVERSAIYNGKRQLQRRLNRR